MITRMLGYNDSGFNNVLMDLLSSTEAAADGQASDERVIGYDWHTSDSRH